MSADAPSGDETNSCVASGTQTRGPRRHPTLVSRGAERVATPARPYERIHQWVQRTKPRTKHKRSPARRRKRSDERPMTPSWKPKAKRTKPSAASKAPAKRPRTPSNNALRAPMDAQGVDRATLDAISDDGPATKLVTGVLSEVARGGAGWAG